MYTFSKLTKISQVLLHLMQFTLGETHALSLLLRVPELKQLVPLDWHQTPPVLVLIKSVLEVQDKFAGEQILSLEYVQRGLLVPTAIGNQMTFLINFTLIMFF